MRKDKTAKVLSVLGCILILVFAVGVFAALDSRPASTDAPLKVIAAENVWGSLVSQLAGDKAQVTSMISDPNADPHEYESNTAAARDFSESNLIVINGAGYDSWADRLMSSGSMSGRKVIDVAQLVGKKAGDNPHLWYGPAYVDAAVLQMKKDLIALDPKDKGYFENNYKTLVASLSTYQGRIRDIKKQYAGTRVAATEDIFAYLADASGLDLISPRPFITAVAEGNDPPTDSVVAFQQQLQSRQPVLLVYNEQTVTPLTENVRKMAVASGIPVVGITETIQPPGERFQDWMNSELINLQNALKNGQATE